MDKNGILKLHLS